jgi:hypothetical protein
VARRLEGRASLAFVRWLLDHESFCSGARRCQELETSRFVVLPGDFQGVRGSGGEHVCCLPVRLCSRLKMARMVSLSQEGWSSREAGLRIEDVPWS